MPETSDAQATPSVVAHIAIPDLREDALTAAIAATVSEPIASAPHNALPPAVRPNFLSTRADEWEIPASAAAAPIPKKTSSLPNLLKLVDYSVLQQCMHCGLCLPTCPTYDATGLERNSPRGRIALMRAIADGNLDASKTFADEMYFCLGCLACETACPAGVEYAHLFELARSDAETSGVLQSTYRDRVRMIVLRGIFTRPWLLKLAGRGLWFYRVSGVQWIARRLNLVRFLPSDFRRLEPQTPAAHFMQSNQLIRENEQPDAATRFRVGLLTGCVQDIVFPDVNRDTATVLLANGCAVSTPRNQHCCGSLHAHNGDLETARAMARKNIDAFELGSLDAIITNAAGCGSHLKHYDRLLEDDPAYRERAVEWSAKLRDIHEWLIEIGFEKPQPSEYPAPAEPVALTYHEACHLCHGQKISAQPREILRSIPGIELRELPEAQWCCGSAGVYNITQPEMSSKLLTRKLGHLQTTKAECVATANPGCMLQLQNGLRQTGDEVTVKHPVSLLAQAYRAAAAPGPEKPTTPLR
jgi:glycolate oxidase iron-sulfur subunit